MSGTLSPDVIAAINKVAATPLGRKYDRMARRKYGKSGVALAAKEVVGESGGRSNAVSSAGARGLTQFMPGTRADYLRRYGVDAWASPAQAIKAMELYQTAGGGIESYNPGMPTYASYILNQRLDPATNRALIRRPGQQQNQVSSPGTPPGSFTLTSPKQTTVEPNNSVIPGQSFAAERQAARDSLFLTPGKLDMQKLLAYKTQVNGLQDIPDQTVNNGFTVNTTGGKPIKVPTIGSNPANSPADNGLDSGGNGRHLKGTSHSLTEMFRIAEDVDKLNNKGKVPYLWGGGHGTRPAKVGEAVDCSGFVSQILGVAPRVSGQFASSWGTKGRGKWVTVYANNEHVLIAMRDPRNRKVRWFATSRSNPGGGAGEIAPPTPAYLSRFTARHPG